MLIKKIQEHNYLNGLWFVIAEFSIFILVILPITMYYLIHKQLLLGILGAGLFANFAVVLFYAVRSVIKKAPSLGIHKIYGKKIRTQIKIEYPHLSKDTFILFTTLIVPFLLAGGIWMEQLHQPRSRGETSGNG